MYSRKKLFLQKYKRNYNIPGKFYFYCFVYWANFCAQKADSDKKLAFFHKETGSTSVKVEVIFLHSCLSMAMGTGFLITLLIW